MKKLMKRLLTITMTGALSMSMLVGCSSPTGSLEAVTTTPSAPSDNENKEVVVGFVFDGYIDDGAWCQEHNKGRIALEEAGFKTVYKENVPQSQECEKVMKDLINQGANVIVGTTFGFMDYMVKVAKEYPDVQFLHCGGYIQSDNMHNFLGRQYQTRFLAGLIAGTETKTDEIGYVAAFEIPEVIRGINAFTLGARVANPEAKVNVRWTHTWYDPAIEKEAGQALLDEGCDILTAHESTAASLMPAEEKGAFTIGYPADFSGVLPKSYLTSSSYDWANFYVPTVTAIQERTWDKQDFWGGLETGVPVLSAFSSNVSEASKALVAEYEARIKEGSYDIFAGPIFGQNGELVVEEGATLSDADLQSITVFVEGVVGNIQ